MQRVRKPQALKQRGEDEECRQNFGRETFCKEPTSKTLKETRVADIQLDLV